MQRFSKINFTLNLIDRKIPKFSIIDFTKNLIDRKIPKYPHFERQKATTPLPPVPYIFKTAVFYCIFERYQSI